MGTKIGKYVQTATTTAVVTGGLMMVDGAIDPDDITAYRLGLAVVTLAGTALVAWRCRTSAGMLERSRQDGYDDGYVDGCDATRPARVVVLGSSCDPPRRAFGSPAHQLGEQGHLRGGADRVG